MRHCILSCLLAFISLALACQVPQYAPVDPKGGFAWHYRRFENQQDWLDRVAYRDAETAAREAGIGLWADSDPEPPWQHRNEERER